MRDVEHLEGEDKNIPSDYPEIVIPKHLRELVCKSQLKKWIDSAIHAKYRCKEGTDFYFYYYITYLIFKYNKI